MAVEDLNLTGPGDETTTNGNGQDNTQNTDAEITLSPGDGMSTSAFADYSSTMTFKPIYGTSNPDIFQGASVSHIGWNLNEMGLGEAYGDLSVMHEFLKNNTDARNSFYSEQARGEDVKNFNLDYRQTDGKDKSTTGFGSGVMSQVEELSQQTGLPQEEFLHNMAVFPAIQKNVNSQYTIAVNSQYDYNAGFIPFTDYAEMTISNNNMSDLLTYNLGETISDGLEFNIKSKNINDIYNMTADEFEQDIIRNTYGIGFNDRKDLVSNFTNASPQEKVELYQELFSLETKLSDRVLSGDDPILFQHQKDYNAASDEFQSLVSSGIITIDIPKPPVATEGTFVEAETMEPDPSSGLVDVNVQQAIGEMSYEFEEPTFEEKYKAEYDQARKAYISKTMREKYGEDWSRNYEIEQAAVDGLNKVKEIMERTNLSYKDVIRQLNGDILPSLDPDQYGIPGSTGLVYDFGELKSLSPSRDKLAPNTPEAILSEIRGQFIKNKSIKKSVGDGAFRVRKYTDEEAYALAVNLAEGKGMSAYLGGFDEDGDGALSEKEAGTLINSLLEEQAAEYNWLSGQKKLHEQLAIASIVMNDNRDVMSEGDLQDVEIAGITYKATPRQVQLYQHHMRMANDYGMRFSTFAPSDIKDVYGELAYIKAEDQIALDQWAAENPFTAFLAVTGEATRSGIFSGARGVYGAVSSIFAEAAYLVGADDVGDRYYEAADGILGDEMTVPTIAQMTGIRLSEERNGYRFMTNKEGDILGPALDAETFARVDPRLSNEVLASMSDEEIKELGLTSSYERSLSGFYSNGLKIGTQILSTMNSGAVAGLYSTGLSQAGRATLMNSAKMGTIFLTSYDAQYDMLSKSGISPREASLAAAANSVFTTLTAQAFGVEFFGKASPLFNKVLGRYSDDLVKAVAQADSKAVAQVNAEITKTIMAGAGLEFTQETLDQIQKNITKELLLGGSVIDGIPGLNESIDIAILSATFGGAGAAATINISDFTTTQQEYFVQLTKDPVKLQSRLDKAVQRGEITQEQANRAMVLAKEYIENTSTSLAGVTDNIRHEIVVEQIKINQDLEAANNIKDDATRQESVNEINERQKRLDDKINNSVEMDRLNIYSFKADEIPAHLLNHTMRFNDKTGEMEVFATKREVELGYNSNVNVIVKDGKVSGIIESNAASISSDSETNMVTIKVTDQYKGAKVSIYNELGQLVKFENADTETGEVTFDGSSVRDGGYSVKVEGQLDIIPGLDIEAEGKTQSQIQSDLDAAVVEDAVTKIEANGVPITKLTNEQYDSIPVKDGVNPKDTKAMVVDGVIVLRQDQPPSSRELFEEVAHWVLTNPDFETEGQFVDFNTVVEALNSDPAAAGIIDPADLEALTRLYPKGQVSNEALAGVLADLAVGHKELNLSSRGMLYDFISGIRDMVSPSKTTVNEGGEMNTTPSRISLYNSQDVTNTLIRLSDVMSKGGVIEATSLAAKLPATDVDTTPEVQATMKDSKRLQDQVDAGEISLDNETQSTKDLFQDVMSADLSAYPNLEAGRERFAKEALADPNNLAIYLKAFQNDIDAEAYNISGKRSNSDTDEDIELSIQESRLPGNATAIIPAAKILAERGDYDGAIRLLDEAIERSPNKGLLYLQRASVKEARNNPGDKESAALDRQEGDFIVKQNQRDSGRNQQIAEEADKLTDSRRQKPKPKPEEEASQDVQQAMPEDQQEDMPEDQQEETQTTPKDDVTPAVNKEQIIDEIIAKSQRLNSEEFLNSIPNALNRRLVVMFNRDINLDRASLQALKDARLNKINEALNQALELESFNPFLTQYIDLKSRQESEKLSNVIKNLPEVDVLLFRSRTNAKVRATFNSIMSRSGTIADQTQAIEAMLNGVTSSMIDLGLGNYNNTDVKEALIEPWMESTGVFLLEYSNMAKEVSGIMDKAFGTKDFESNSRVESKYRVQAALLQLEFLLNPDNPKVASIEKYIDAIVEPFEGTGRGIRSQEYSRHDIKILKQIKKDFAKLDMSSVDAYLASLKNTLSPEEYSAFEDMQTMYEKLRVYNEYVNGTILGAEVVNYEGYVHHASIVMDQAAELKMNTNALSATEVRSQRATETPPPTLERTTTVGPIHFDVEYVFNRAAKSLIEYAYVAPASELTATTFEKAGTKLEDKNVEIYQAIGGYMSNLTQAVLNNVSSVDKTQNLLGLDGGLYSTLKTNAYRYILGGKNRIADLASNMIYATMFPEVMAKGSMAYMSVWNSDMSMSTILSNVDCTVAQRVIPSQTGMGGRGGPVEPGKVVNEREQARAYYENVILNAIKQSPLMEAKALGQLIDNFITMPDRPFAGPIWFGNMAIEFENFTGQKIDWGAIHNNDAAYMNKYASAIREARRKADEAVTNIITQTGSLADMRVRILNIKNKRGGIVADALFPMATFHLNDIDNFKKAWVALFKEGKMTRKQATQLWSATTARQITYFTLKAMLAQYSLSLFADDEYDDGEEDMTLSEALKKGTLQHLASQYGLYDGNAATNMFVSSGINTAQEWMTEGDVAIEDQIAFGNSILQEMGRGVDHNASSSEVINSTLSILGPVFSTYGKPLFKWLKIEQELKDLPLTTDNPKTNRRRQRLLAQQKELESMFWPLGGEFMGMFLGAPLMPGARDWSLINKENISDRFFDGKTFENQALAEALYIYSVDLNRPIYENVRMVTDRDKYTNEITYTLQRYNGYDDKPTRDQNNKQVGITWSQVMGNVNNYIQSAIDELVFQELKSKFPNATSLRVEDVQDASVLRMFPGMLQAKSEAVKNANEALGVEQYSLANEVKRIDNTGSKGEGYDFLMNQIGDFSYTHFGVKNTVALNSIYGGDYGVADVYYTYEELNELKFDEYSLINDPSRFSIVDGERFYSVREIKKLYEDSPIVQEANTPDLSFSRQFDGEDRAQIESWILDGHVSYLGMPEALKNANDDDMIPLSEMSKLTPYGMMLSRAITEDDLPGSEDDYVFLYGDGETHDGHSNFTYRNGEIFPEAWQDIPYPKTDYVNMYDASLKAP